MQDLIDNIVAGTGVDSATAERALGILLGLVRNHGDQEKAEELLAKLPGAAELAEKYGSSGFMSGPLAAMTKLSSAGLSMEQIKQAGRLTLRYAREKAGAALVREAAGSIPGLGSYV